LRMVGTHSDVTARKLAETRLAEREARFRGVFSSTFQLMGVLDSQGRVIEGNDIALGFAGLRNEDIAGMPFWELPYFRASERTSTLMRNAVERAMRGELVRAEVELAGIGDRRMTVDFSLKPVFGADGRVSMLIPEGRDISERKRAEQTLRES